MKTLTVFKQDHNKLTELADAWNSNVPETLEELFSYGTLDLFYNFRVAPDKKELNLDIDTNSKETREIRIFKEDLNKLSSLSRYWGSDEKETLTELLRGSRADMYYKNGIVPEHRMDDLEWDPDLLDRFAEAVLDATHSDEIREAEEALDEIQRRRNKEMQELNEEYNE